MNETDKFALVSRQPGALEKAEPGAKRILSGMITDMLALAKPTQPTKPVRSVLLLKDNTFDEMWEMFLKSKFGQKYNLRFTRFESASELLSLAQKENFDLIIMYFGNVRWDVPDRDPFDLLASLKYGQRIIVTQGLDLSEQCARIGASFLESPYKLEQAQAAIQLALEAPHHLVQGLSEHTPDFSKTRPLRIVIVNDEQGPLRSFEVVLRGFKGATLSLFKDAREAWEELLRADPALLITGAMMPGLTGKEIARRLLDRQATFPIIVTSAYEPEEQWVQEYTRLGLNITFLRLPFDISDFRTRVETALKSPGDKIEKSRQVTPSSRPVQPSGAQPRKIIQVDDDRDLLDLYREIIQSSFKNVEVMSFTDANAALNELSSTFPDLFITDLNMPKTDGLQVLSILAGMNVKFPVMMLTSIMDSGFEERAHKIADPHFVFAYFNNPGNGEEVRKFVREVSRLIGIEPTTASLDSLVPAKVQAQNMPATPSYTSADLESWCQMGESHYYGRGMPKDYTEAAKWFRKAAERGHARAQCWLAIFYERARGVSQDFTESMKWYRKAAEQGYADAQNALGAGYQTGRGIPQDYNQAVTWYRKAAEQGNDFAEYNLGVCYRDGFGLPHNSTEAFRWFRKAAVQGNADAQCDLGHCCFYGQGVPKDEVEAVKWVGKAAVQNHPRAQIILGQCHRDGRSVASDNCEAYRWLKLAANNGANEHHKWFRPAVNNATDAELATTAIAAERGRKLAAEELALLSSTMSPEELREGERRYLESKTGG